MTEEKIKEKNILVVSELPKKEIRNIIDDKNEEYELLTTEEALTELLKSLKKIEKALGAS